MMFRLVGAILFVCLLNPLAVAEEIGGVEFPFGVASFADRLTSFTAGANVQPPWDDATRGLGIPDDDGTEDTSFALGEAGSVVFEFFDNFLVDQSAVENGNDLYVFEVGPIVEAFDVAISADGISYTEVGRVSGQPTAIDIGPFVQPGDTFRFVRLTDDGDGSSPLPFAGADIDSVGAIGSVVPEPGAMQFLVLGAVGLIAIRSRRRNNLD